MLAPFVSFVLLTAIWAVGLLVGIHFSLLSFYAGLACYLIVRPDVLRALDRCRRR